MTTITKKPNRKKEEFIENAGSDLAQGQTTKQSDKQNKKQVLVTIHPELLKKMDDYLESSSSKISRSSFISLLIESHLNKLDKTE